MKNNNKSDYTINFTRKALSYLSKHADLNEPEQVKQFIANHQVSNGYKKNLCIAYNKYCKYYKIEWEMPLYIPEAKTIRIPTTEKLEMLIARAGSILSIKLTISKETGLRPVELCNLKVKDVDLERKIIYPTTAKRGSGRALKISNNLQKTLQDYINRKNLNLTDKLFKGTADDYGKHYRQMRNQLAKKLNDPSLKTIRLYDFRHYFATTLYAKTRDILYVKQQMGHKKLETTLIYVQLLALTEDDEWTCKTAGNVTEATQLIENGFEYITEMDGLKIFRKRK
ncbi:MAG: site-specific integrase [Candidatus Bathyarchaeota archaeon]|nr:site-specific integrase [Candidatus Bathyarchaeota archaeon]MDH5595572.1 site-specific integrase [Candidatus Bathyarchaeota archaeon]